MGGVLRGLLRAVRTLAVLGLAIFIVCSVFLIGGNIVYWLTSGPWPSKPQAQVALDRDAAVDLVLDSERYDDLVAVLGPPEHVEVSKNQTNLKYYRWRRDAVNATVLDSIPIRIEIGDTRLLQIFPLDKGGFPGSFMGLKLGAAPPTPAQAVAMRKQADDCCDTDYLRWDVSGGRITSIDWQRQVLKTPKPDGH